MRIKTEVKFDAAHYLPLHEGKCSNLHGHTWRVQAELEGEINPKTGMVVDFMMLKDILMTFDHRCINVRMDNPTAERMAEYFCKSIMRALRNENIQDVIVRVYESDVSFAEAWSGDYEGQ